MVMTRIGGVVMLSLLAGVAAGGEVYYDYAPVSWVEPVTRAAEYGREPACPPPGPGAKEAAATGGAGARGMVAAMRTLAMPGDAPACNRSSPGPPRVVGYRVGYVYAGEEYVRMLDHDPGNRLRVKVSLEARP